MLDQKIKKEIEFSVSYVSNEKSLIDEEKYELSIGLIWEGGIAEFNEYLFEQTFGKSIKEFLTE